MNSHDADGLVEQWVLRVRGRVQGVGYRDACVRRARAVGIRGWVRNRSDGSVEMTLQGSPADVAAMRTWLQTSVPGARVTDLDATQVPAPFPHLSGFDRLPTE
jgi:acylphosphatase